MSLSWALMGVSEHSKHRQGDSRETSELIPFTFGQIINFDELAASLRNCAL